jgi:hypothetical protein
MRQSYNEADIITIPISTGASFVDPANSTIKFRLNINLTAATAAKYLFFWGNDTLRRQNALNLFSEFRVVHSSGYEADRMGRGYAAWKYLSNAYAHDFDWFLTHGSLMRGTQVATDTPDSRAFRGNDGGGPAYPPQAPDAVVDTAATAQPYPGSMFDGTDEAFADRRPFGATLTATVALPVTSTIAIDVEIPLSEISGIWAGNDLSPSFLMAGARIELTLQNKEQAFIVRNGLAVAPAVTNWNYTITNVKAKLETVTFTDAILRSISMTSANTGLEIPFVAVHYAQANTNTSSQSIQVNRAVSRANAVVVRPYPQTSIANTIRTSQLDSVAAYFLPLGDTGFQVKLGAEFMPATPIKDPIALYQAAQIAWGNWKAREKNTVRMVDYVGQGPLGFVSGAAAPAQTLCPRATLSLLAMTLEKSGTLAQSGSPISAARDLNVVFGGESYTAYNDPIWGGMMCDVFVPHIALVTVFLDSILARS